LAAPLGCVHYRIRIKISYLGKFKMLSQLLFFDCDVRPYVELITFSLRRSPLKTLGCVNHRRPDARGP